MKNFFAGAALATFLILLLVFLEVNSKKNEQTSIPDHKAIEVKTDDWTLIGEKDGCKLYYRCYRDPEGRSCNQVYWTVCGSNQMGSVSVH